MSYVTQAEIDAMQESELSRETPFLICNVSQTQFSVSRYYGACSYNGVPYTYISESDELIRDDVLSFLSKLRHHQKTKTKTSQPGR